VVLDTLDLTRDPRSHSLLQSAERVLNVAAEPLEPQPSALDVLREGKKMMKNTHKKQATDWTAGFKASVSVSFTANPPASQLAADISPLGLPQETTSDIKADRGLLESPPGPGETPPPPRCA